MADKLVVLQTSRKQICPFFFKVLLIVNKRHKIQTSSPGFVELLLCVKH